MRPFSSFAILVMIAAAIALSGCGDDTTQPEITTPPYVAPTSEQNVLQNLRHSWQWKDIAGYASLLADDYQFYFDENTRITHGLPVFWTRFDDWLGVAGLFASPHTRSITVALTGMQEPQAVTQPRPATWTRVDVRQSYLEVVVDPNPEQPEGMTYKVNSSLQHFYLRKGRTADDTLAASPTSSRYYIVEWDDTGQPSGSGPGWRGAAPAGAVAALPGSMSENASWGAVKALYGNLASPAGAAATPGFLTTPSTWGSVKALYR